MFKSVSSLFLVLGFSAALHFQKREGEDTEPIQTIRTDEISADEISKRDDLLDLMIATGARDHRASHKDEDPAHLKEIEGNLLAALNASQARMENIKTMETATGQYGLVWVHGAGFYNWKPLMEKYLKITQKKASLSMAFPKAPETHVSAWGMFSKAGVSWYDMKFLPVGKENEPPLYGCALEDAKKNLPLIHQQIDALITSGVPANNIVVAGMSQGGYMAMRAAMTYPKKLGGVFVYAGMLLDADELKANVAPANKDIEIEWLHGKNDDVLLPSMQEQGVEDLQKIGFHPAKTSSNAHHTSHPVLYERLNLFMNKLMIV